MASDLCATIGLTACQHAAIMSPMAIPSEIRFELNRKVTIRISDELFKKLGHYCVDADKSVNQVITELLEKLVSEGKKPKR
jgi:predicted HicB family RNase H-like nuclease